MQPIDLTDQAQAIQTVAANYHLSPEQLRRYIASDELVMGFGKGGSEAIVIFLRTATGRLVVRKIWNAEFIAVDWDEDGQGVMLPPLQKALRQVDYLSNLPRAARPYFPEVLGSKVTYRGERLYEVRCDQEYVEGIEVSRFIAEQQPSPEVVAHLHAEILRCLRERVHPNRRAPRTSMTLEASYFAKIIERLEITKAAAPSVFGTLLRDEFIWIDGHRYRNLPSMVEEFRSMDCSQLEPKRHVFVTGDTNTENVMIRDTEPLLRAMRLGERPTFTYEDLRVAFLDPRAIGHESTGGATVDDYMYDNKPLHNSLGNYDVIHGEYFDLSFSAQPHVSVQVTHHADHPFRKPYTGMDAHFGTIMRKGWGLDASIDTPDDPSWLTRFVFIMGTHFAAMPPFHIDQRVDGSVVDDPQVQKRAVAIYCEGVKWLNKAHGMMTGEVTEIYGLPIPRRTPQPRALSVR